jgi:hypothetical protein
MRPFDQNRKDSCQVLSAAQNLPRKGTCSADMPGFSVKNGSTSRPERHSCQLHLAHVEAWGHARRMGLSASRSPRAPKYAGISAQARCREAEAKNPKGDQHLRSRSPHLEPNLTLRLLFVRAASLRPPPSKSPGTPVGSHLRDPNCTSQIRRPNPP